MQYIRKTLKILIIKLELNFVFICNFCINLTTNFEG